MIRVFLLSLFILLSNLIFADDLEKSDKPDFSFKTDITNSEVFIGDIINYDILIDKKEKNDSFFIKKPNFSPFELIDISETNSDKNYKFSIKLRIYKTGDSEIPSIDILAYHKDSNTNISIPKKEIVIKSLLTDTQNVDIVDIKSNTSIREKTYILFWILGVVLLLVIVFIIVKIYKYKKTLVKEAVELPPRAANEIAYEKLSLLISKKLIQKGEYKKYYFELSEIIREYLGNRYKFDSIELTSDELLVKLKQTLELSRSFIPTIENFLEDTDLVKFSKVIPETSEVDSVTQGGFKIIEELK